MSELSGASITINIDDYLTESDKRELVREAFKEQVLQKLFNTKDLSKNECERLISNISYYSIVEYVQQFIPDFEEKIRERVAEVIEEDYQHLSYKVFYSGGYSEKPSLGFNIIQDVVRENKELIKSKVKTAIENHRTETVVNDKFIEITQEHVSNMREMLDIFYKKQEAQAEEAAV